MLTAFREAFDPVTQVLGVEEYFQLGLGDSPPLTGYIDLIEQDRNGRIIIVDLKTASKKPSAMQANQNLQLTAYSLGIQALGFDPHRGLPQAGCADQDQEPRASALDIKQD